MILGNIDAWISASNFAVGSGENMSDVDGNRQRPLAGQVAVVTGSTQGIGAGIAVALAENGARVIVHGRDGQRADGEKIVAAIEATGSQAALVTGDLLEVSHCRSIIRTGLDRFGRVDILVNNAAVVYRSTIEDTSTELWDEVFAVNIRAPFLLCQEAVHHMKERQSGCIVNIGSRNGYCGGKKLLPYSASKGALMTFTKNLASYLAQYRIRVNMLVPGWTLTEGERHVIGVVEGKGENWVEAAGKTRPSGRLLLPSDVSKGVLFFAMNEMISGAVLNFEQSPFDAPPESGI
jgi:NAD(P)-dependent dehydrogenase (short-subunit alcohol dehydrogenase family)